MKYGFVMPFGDARTAAELARLAEAHQWDGFFVWEPVWGVEAWICLAAAAMVTEHIRLGTMLSPLSRMRPWKLAGEAATVDNLSRGRVILSVGLGAPDTGFAEFGEVTDRKTRAELLDEGLDILTGLWRGMPFTYDGKHYHVQANSKRVHTPGRPLPVQKPRIPIWVVGAWPRMKSMQRVLKYDGLLPAAMEKDGNVRMGPPTLDELREMRAWIEQHRTATTPFDIVVEGQTPGENRTEGASMVQPWIDAGATWWLESMWEEKEAERVLARVKQGPPREA